MDFIDLRSYLKALAAQGELKEIDAQVDPELEIAEIHRRIIDEAGPALLFKSVKGSSWPVVTNLFGTKKRVDLAFGSRARSFIEKAAAAPHELFPPSLPKLWKERSFLAQGIKIGMRRRTTGPVLEQHIVPPRLKLLPALKTWKDDGGAFLTWPAVYTEHPDSGIHNLGIYRMQVFSDEETGMHMQIGKGGGFHLKRAEEKGRSLQVNVFLGGPPALILSAVAPLPENVPELIFASLALGGRLELAANPYGPLPLVANAEFALIGSVDPKEKRPEGPFGDHYGYYSLQHDYPVFRCNALTHRHNPIYPATVVGKPRQEDFFIGDYLQETLSPLFPLVMPGVKDLWSYGETGYHSLAAAVVNERYRREALVHAFRILGEGQLSLTKFLLVVDKGLNLRDFRAVLEHVLERVDLAHDVYLFSNSSMDTLDYTGPEVNEGSKGIILGLGEKKRDLPGHVSSGLPPGVRKAAVFTRGCLVLSGPDYRTEPGFAKSLGQDLAEWPLVVVCDDAEAAASSPSKFLWTVFTRFEPAADISSREVSFDRYHPSFAAPLVIDARMKPPYPAELECDEATKKLVDRRWSEYFGSSH